MPEAILDVFVKKAHGAYIVGEDDKEYIDYVGSWGPMILGHAHPKVISAVRDAAGNGDGRTPCRASCPQRRW